MKIAINQPYLWPYGGYIRLIASTDLFVIYDCVQFARRSYLHRNKLPNRNKKYEWVTLPLKKCSRDTLIKDLEFHEMANSIWRKNLRKFPIFDNGNDWPLIGTPVEYIVKNLKAICELLEIPFNVAYSSPLSLPKELKGQDRILAICNHFKATEYVNAPGGKKLYDENAFRLNGIKLSFLPDYDNKKSMFERICTESLKDLRSEIYG